jgi:hypothetical protein
VATSPAVEVDHVFVMCDAGAPEIAALERIGLLAQPRRSHPGQGTANTCVVFENAYLELLWVHDEDEARAPVTAPARLWDRWAGRRGAACPFGIGLRPATPGGRPPFATWPYRPGYLPEGMAIDMATDTPLAEPELFFMATLGRRPSFVALARQHALPLGPLASVEIELPGAAPLSPACVAAEAAGIAAFARSGEQLLRLGFGVNPGAAGRADLRPTLPIVLAW